MLSKLRHAGVAGPGPAHLEMELQARFGPALADLHPLPGGTLGICFTGELNGRKRFFKTHAVPAGRDTLARELLLLRCTAGDAVDAQLLEVTRDGATRTWLHMKALQPCAALEPPQVRALVAGMARALADCAETPELPAGDNLALLLEEAGKALQELAAQSLVSSATAAAARACLDRLDRASAEWPARLCHGDLGPANILADGRGPVLVDWEDAFWGVEGYDYLYWLTFFSNRKWLSPAVLGYTPWGAANEVAIMVMVLVLKSLLSVRNGSHRTNSLGIDERLSEVIALA